MDELDKLLPTPPHLGPPLPGILRAYWPWVKQPPGKESTLPMAEAPKLVTASAPKPAPVPAATQRTINYEVETPPEIPPAGMLSKTLPSVD